MACCIVVGKEHSAVVFLIERYCTDRAVKAGKLSSVYIVHAFDLCRISAANDFARIFRNLCRVDRKKRIAGFNDIRNINNVVGKRCIEILIHLIIRSCHKRGRNHIFLVPFFYMCLESTVTHTEQRAVFPVKILMNFCRFRRLFSGFSTGESL